MTSLLYGKRVPKTHPRMQACGAVDELNSALGIARALTKDFWIGEQILLTQKDLIALMGELVLDDADRERYQQSDFLKLTEESLKRLDEGIAKIEVRKIKFDDFVIPGQTPSAASLDFARSVCRRAEREVLTLAADGQACWQPLSPLILQYMNRLSDLLWLLARLSESQN